MLFYFLPLSSPAQKLFPVSTLESGEAPTGRKLADQDEFGLPAGAVAKHALPSLEKRLILEPG